MLIDDTRNVRPPGPLGKALALLTAAILLILGFMFSLVLVVVAITLGLMFWGYVWWKTRELRRRLREAAVARPMPAGGTVIEGEARQVDDEDRGPRP